MRIAFIGTVDFSWQCLDEMLSLGANVVLAAYVDPRYAGGISDYHPLDDLCRSHGVPSLTFRKVGDASPMAALAAARPDVVFVLGLSQLLPPALLDLPPAGCIGTHPALLPRNRGRAVIPWSILLHHERGGLSLFYLTPEVDAGDIIAQAEWPITPDDTATTIYYDKLVPAGRRLIRENLPAIVAGTAPRIPQDHALATYLPRRTPDDGRIDWRRPPAEIHDLVRATARPYPGAFTAFNGRKIVVWKSRVTGGSGFGVRDELRIADCGLRMDEEQDNPQITQITQMKEEEQRMNGKTQSESVKSPQSVDCSCSDSPLHTHHSALSQSAIRSPQSAVGTVVEVRASAMLVACVDGALWLEELTGENGQPLSASEFTVGAQLG